MQLDLQPVRAMMARLVEHHVSIRHEEQPVIALEKKPVALLKCFCPNIVVTRVTVRSSDSITMDLRVA